jgi:hypothetical protein
MALEIKTPRDDVTRGIGQLTEAIAFGYDTVVLVTTLNKAQSINLTVFKKMNFMLLGVDSKGRVRTFSGS